MRRARANLEHRLRDAVDRSLPLFSYHETKTIFYQQYAAAVRVFKGDHTWDEVKAMLGVTRERLNQIEAKPRPGPETAGLRLLLATLQDAGDAGMTLSEVAGEYFSRLDKHGESSGLSMTLEGMLTLLGSEGDVTDNGDRYFAKRPSVDLGSRDVRRMLLLLQQRPQRWNRLSWIAPRYYENVGIRMSEPPEIALRVLEDLGLIESRGGAFRVSSGHKFLPSPARGQADEIDDIERNFGHIARAVSSAEPQPDSCVFQVAVTVPPGAHEIRLLGEQIIAAVRQVVVETEARATLVGDAEGDEAVQKATIVFAIGPGVL